MEQTSVPEESLAKRLFLHIKNVVFNNQTWGQSVWSTSYVNIFYLSRGSIFSGEDVGTSEIPLISEKAGGCHREDAGHVTAVLLTVSEECTQSFGVLSHC